MSARWFSASLMCVGETAEHKIHLHETQMELANFFKMSHIIKASTKFMSNEAQEKQISETVSVLPAVCFLWIWNIFS